MFLLFVLKLTLTDRGVDMFFKKNKEQNGSSFDFAVVGLGNPGREYEQTRHNAGFLTLDRFCEKQGCRIEKSKFKSLTGECVLNGKRILLLKPQTFMNSSGEAVRDACRFYKIPPERTVIIFDDISLPVGKLRIKRKGSDGGHNGIKSIINLCGSDAFPRIKVGVGEKPHPEYDLKDWVLSRFTKQETDALATALEHGAEAIECIVCESIDSAMNKFSNR